MTMTKDMKMTSNSFPTNIKSQLAQQTAPLRFIVAPTAPAILATRPRSILAATTSNKQVLQVTSPARMTSVSVLST